MTVDNTRVPREIKEFYDYMQATDDRQIEIDPITTNPRFQNWNWTAAHSGAWTDFRDRSDALYDLWKVKALRRQDDTNNFNLLIEEVLAYDKLHKLLNKIADSTMPPTVLADFETFKVKRGTPLEDTTPTVSEEIPLEPNVDIRDVQHLVHIVEVRNPAHSGYGKGEGIGEMQVWRAVVTGGAPEPDANAYVYVGKAKRGLYRSEFSDTQKRMDAYYKARMESTAGKVGAFSNPVSETII
jgi:hypothetical protein